MTRRAFVMLIVFQCLILAYAHLSVTPRNLAIKWHEERQFSLRIRSFNTSNVTLNFIVQHDDVVKVSPASVVLNQTDRQVYVFKVFAKSPGSTEIYANATNNVNVDDLFLATTVYKQNALNTLSMLIGWAYFLAWSFSYCPQIRSNHARQSGSGLELDYFAFSFLGIAFYALYNIAMYLVQEVQNEYLNRFPRSIIPVKINDVLFAFIGTAMSLVTIGQFIKYEGKYNPFLSKTTQIILGVLVIVFVVLFLLAAENKIVWLDFLNFCSYVCIVTSLVRVTPQVLLNFKQKATIGFRIETVILDIVGGIFSILQMLLDAYNYNDWISFFGNFSKFGLGLNSLIFDFIIVFQYLVLYKHSSYELQ